MNPRKLILILSILCMGISTKAQESKAPMGIFEYLQSPIKGQGIVRIRQSAEIQLLVGTPSPGSIVRDENDVSYMNIPGYRVQVYTGSRNTSKNTAIERKTKLSEEMPELKTYLVYEAPFWKLRAGDFLTYDNAYQAMIRIRQILPEASKEFYVVKDKIRIQEQY